MITEQALQEAIAACEGELNTNANTCYKLASYYTIRDKMFGNPEQLGSYSYAPPPVEDTIGYQSDTEFGRLVSGRKTSEVMAVVDELVSVVQALNPRLYEVFIRKLL